MALFPPTSTSQHHASRLISPAVLKYLVVAGVVSLTIAYLAIQRPTFILDRIHPSHLPSDETKSAPSGPPIANEALLPQRPSTQAYPEHPIEQLINEAQDDFYGSILTKQSHDLVTAARRYRERRGRHPPPGFDAWFAYAQKNNAIIIEDFFDRIYADLSPFWALSPREIRRRAQRRDWDKCISIRNNSAILKDEGSDPMHRMALWFELMGELCEEAKIFGSKLPDVDVPFNIMDESRILVPYEQIESMVEKENEGRTMPPPSAVVGKYTVELPFIMAIPSEEKLPGTEHRKRKRDELHPEESQEFREGDQPFFDPLWITEGSNQFWDLAKLGCAPGSEARNTSSIDIYHDPPLMPADYPAHTHHGFVSNWTLSRDPCQHPSQRSLHGAFIEPVSLRTTQHLLPLFGGSKLPMNNEILVPPAMYLSREELYAGKGLPGPPWPEKTAHGVVWRGVASGGRNKEETWTHFHRHRLLQMLNGTAVQQVEKGELVLGRNLTFTIPDTDAWNISLAQEHENQKSRDSNATTSKLGPWLNTISNAAFTRMWCFPANGDSPLCFYTDPYFAVVPGIPMADQYYSKILPDVDGNSYSGRFRAFLLSTSLPLKATIYSEWHDDRLFPWIHFVPMDNSFVDLYALLEFFLYPEQNPANADGSGRELSAEEKRQQWWVYRDALAERMATSGRKWAERVLRREDMALYMWRLILEYARVSDEKRDVLGFVDDLIDGGAWVGAANANSAASTAPASGQ